jgi:hypothetical protein
MYGISEIWLPYRAPQRRKENADVLRTGAGRTDWAQGFFDQNVRDAWHWMERRLHPFAPDPTSRFDTAQRGPKALRALSELIAEMKHLRATYFQNLSIDARNNLISEFNEDYQLALRLRKGLRRDRQSTGK